MNIARSNAKELWVLILIEIFDPNPKPQLQTQAKAQPMHSVTTNSKLLQATFLINSRVLLKLWALKELYWSSANIEKYFR
ncbi:hypothetical protein EB796_013260 [Bugula neritina]|uniref:Uncharacterized protein n=1 Tax=Bugula neritina TaxID=10212 RepID=A0A7J7JQ09_BUGNE|nr:hypothetical protein EB796_013260 [Bugula neritina]